jgi:hypothetical protein
LRQLFVNRPVAVAPRCGQAAQTAPGRLWLWLLAVAAGPFETTLVVIDATSGVVGSAAEVSVGVTIRLLAFTGLAYLAEGAARARTGRVSP